MFFLDSARHPRVSRDRERDRHLHEFRRGGYCVGKRTPQSIFNLFSFRFHQPIKLGLLYWVVWVMKREKRYSSRSLMSNAVPPPKFLFCSNGLYSNCRFFFLNYFCARHTNESNDCSDLNLCSRRPWLDEDFCNT